MRGLVANVIIIRFKLYRNRLRGFRAVRAQNGGLPLTLTVALTTDEHNVSLNVFAVVHASYFFVSFCYVHGVRVS